MIARLLSFSVCLLASPGLMDCRRALRIPDEFRPVLHTVPVEHGQILRKNLLYVPEGPGPFPLALVFHGGGGAPAHMAGMDRGRLLQLARERHFAVVFPEGVDKHWNDHRDDGVSKAHTTNRDDVGFIGALMDKLAADIPLDASRIVAAGMSNGGFFSYRLACEMPDRLRAIMVVAANLPRSAPERCRPTRPISVTVINGVDDPLVPYQGGEVRVLLRGRGHILSTDATMGFWANVGQCNGSALKEMPVVDGSDPTRVVLHSWNCPSTRLELYEVRGGGHTWPGGVPYLGESMVGRVSHQLNASVILADMITQ